MYNGNTLYHSGNCNNTSTPWSASSLTLNGAISGATTGAFSTSLSAGSIKLQFTDEINRYGGTLYLQHRGHESNPTGSIAMCVNGGNVGIGTASPYYKLQVNGDIYSATAIRAESGFVKSGSSDSYVLLGGGGHKAESNLSVFRWGGVHNTRMPSTGWIRIAKMRNYQTCYISIFRSYGNAESETYSWIISGSTYDPSRINIVQTSGSYGAHYITGIRANFTWNGDVYIEIYITNTYNTCYISVNGEADFIYPEASTSTNTTVELDTQYGFRINQKITTTSVVVANGEITAGSDRRWKHDIEPLKDGIEYIKKLNPCLFMWNEDKGGNPSAGLIAQEAEEVLGERIVRKDEQGYLHLNYDGLHAFEISAIQSHESRIETLERENAELKNTIARLTMNS